MASIPIYRYDYSNGSSQFNGYPPNTVMSGMSAVAIASGTTHTIEADFKDHKTLFTFVNTMGASVNVTFKAGTTGMGCKDLVAEFPAGTSHIWLDSAKFVNKTTGVISVTTDASQSFAAYGVEMR